MTPIPFRSNLLGLRVFTSVDCVKDGDPYQVRRTWRERLFSRPWRPLAATRTVVPKVPAYYIMSRDGVIVAHPAVLNELRRIAHG